MLLYSDAWPHAIGDAWHHAIGDAWHYAIAIGGAWHYAFVIVPSCRPTYARACVYCVCISRVYCVCIVVTELMLFVSLYFLSTGLGLSLDDVTVPKASATATNVRSSQSRPPPLLPHALSAAHLSLSNTCFFCTTFFCTTTHSHLSTFAGGWRSALAALVEIRSQSVCSREGGGPWRRWLCMIGSRRQAGRPCIFGGSGGACALCDAYEHTTRCFPGGRWCTKRKGRQWRGGRVCGAVRGEVCGARARVVAHGSRRTRPAPRSLLPVLARS
jgi:hypothetical protein